MNTFSSTNIIQKNIITKPYLITTEELAEIGSGINLVGYDFLKTLPTPIDETIVNFRYGNPSSPRLLNYVEPYKIAGINYTLFYTEVNSGLKVNDKVFIINGSYDSNLLIQQDKYKKGRDGYKVLFVDECRIVLDIEFVGWLPANETSENQEVFDNFIKVYYIKDQNDFIHVNRQVTTRDGSFDYKFNKNQNNIIFTDKLNGFAPVSDWGETSGLTGSPGFFIKNGTSNWINISNDFMLGSYSIATAGGANDKILILNGSFTHSYSNGVFTEFKEDSVYSWKYDSISGTYSWLVNVKHENNNPPIITKSNFRRGKFDGKWNGGLYGTSDERIIWNSKTATWNSGTLLNTIWQTGIMNSFYSQPSSYFSEFDYSFATSSAPYGLPYQKVNNPDNNGYGYNFVINSDIQNAVINNGNVTNSKLGASASSYQIVEEYLKTGTIDLSKFSATSSIVVNKALFDNCKFINANIENTEIRNCRAENSRFNKVKSVNSHYKSSLFLNSNYISDNIIKVLDYDEFTYSYNSLTSTHKVYKFYINKRSYEKFKFKDSFYIKGIKINNNSGELLNFFDTKFKIGPWIEYIDFNSNFDNDGFIKSGVRYNAFVSTPKENEYKYSVNNTLNELFDPINKDYYSVDIFVSISLENGNIYAPQFNNTFLGTGILDFSEAYIVSSDFESGIFENSNWNSGNHINYSNDNNITKDILNGGGFYSLTGTNSISFSNIISSGGIASEVDYDYLETGSIVFLNAVDYDTRGKVTSFVIDNPGSLYTNGTFSTSGGSGTGLTINVNASTIGAAFTIELIPDNNNYYYASTDYANIAGGGYTTRQTTGGSGTGLEVEIVVNEVPGAYYITSVSVINPGSGYNIDDELDISLVSIGNTNNEGPGTTKLKITNILNGGVLTSSTQSFQGLGYQINDIITINSGNSDAKIRVTGITGSLTRLPDAYKIVNRTILGTNQKIDLESINTFPNLLEDGLFLTMGAQNKYGYLHRTKFNRSRIITGIFKRAYIVSSLLKDENFDVSDRDFNNIKKLKNLIFVDTIFSNNSNILSKATYMNSSFVGGNDIWDNGILYDSIWNGGNFRNGLVKESIWVDGIFSDGLFYNSRSFDNDSFTSYNENVKTRYYKSGTESNVRFSWQNGTFLNGEFYKSDWESGVFNGGKFYYSKFYNGTFNNGVIGDKSIPIDDTWFYNGVINYAVVENSKIVSQKYNGISNSVITWNNGIFNSGVFGTNDNQSVVNFATWNNGIFNGGVFRDSAKWKDGIFNGGKFLSNYGFINGVATGPDAGSTSKELYAWEYGIFNGGEFGNANTATNSTWFDGEFNGGQFKGRVWNNGIFSFGEFLGSGDVAIGGTPSILLQSNPDKFAGAYSQSPKRHYGLWRKGYVTDIKDKYITDRKLYTDLKRANDTTRVVNKAIFKNMLWLGGTFTHPGGEMNNSVWLDGTFENGRFLSSSFNPYVFRSYDNTPNVSFNFNESCSWKNGIFDGGEFNISTWDNGTFVSGTATGMIWKNGITNYMNAYNVFWENGLWRNGNWNGSYFNLGASGSVTDNYTLQVLQNGMSFSATSSVHVWNIFYDEPLSDFNSFDTTGWGGFIAGTSSDTPPSWNSGSTFSEGGNNPIITLTNVYTQESPTIQDIVFYLTWTTSGFSNITSIDAEWKSSSAAMWVQGSNIPLVTPNTETSGNTSFQQGSPQQGDYPIDVRLSAYENGSTNPVFSNVFVVNQQTPLFRIEFIQSNTGGPFKIFDGPPNSQVTLKLTSSTQDSGTWILYANNVIQTNGTIPINSPVYYANLDVNGESDELLISTGGGQMSGSLFIIVFECIDPNTQQPYTLPQSPYDRLDQQL
jgi:hypothetical protein